jgi:uncharacterized membrane protein YccC
MNSGPSPSGHAHCGAAAVRNSRETSPGAKERYAAVIFAAKTTASGLIALLVAFTFNLDQPYWALLTVFIVSQPQSGLVLAKSFYRIIGTVIGASVALVLVALFAQERILFLGSLALWIGLCTFGSQYARNFAAYSFVLSGYTVAIVGVPGALDAGNAFYIAVGRVTEISLGYYCGGHNQSHRSSNLARRLAAASRCRRSRGARRLCHRALQRRRARRAVPG